MGMPQKPPIPCIMGPTAAGKTDAAIALAEAIGGELISVDSALVYRGLTIGAAKPAYPHHLIDIRDPAEMYSAADFARDALHLIADIEARGRRPIFVGGTMLYFRALLGGLDDMPATDLAVRAQIEHRAAAEGWPALHAELQRFDPITAARLHPNHSQRISRALEVYYQSGKPLSDWQRGSAIEVSDRFRCVAICPLDRQILHARIHTRFEHMLTAGLWQEVEALYARGDLTTDMPAVRAVGYRQLWSALAGEIDRATAIERALAATRQLAKRQLTWLRKWPNLIWLYTDPQGRLLEVRFPEGDGGGQPVSRSFRGQDTDESVICSVMTQIFS
jgi:tRNA dimethylallyltransferase